jgi:glycoprotein endo-alpha-1,2-mannosidase
VPETYSILVLKGEGSLELNSSYLILGGTIMQPKRLRIVGWASGLVVFWAYLGIGQAEESPSVPPPPAWAARKVLTFYYPWYGNPKYPEGSGRWSHWEGVDPENKQIASSTNYPKLGAYDSHDPKVIAQHAEWSKQAGIHGWIVSWWGRGDFTDRAMPRILDTCQRAGLQVTIYYETVRGKKTPENAAQELLEVLKTYADHPAWFRWQRKPVLFIYGRALDELGMDGWRKAIDQLRQNYPKGVLLIGDRMSREAARLFDGIHTYNTAGHLKGRYVQEVRDWCQKTFPGWVALARKENKIATLTVIPGYDDTKIRKPGLQVPRFEGHSYALQWEAAIAARPDWILITSFNEWHEGSEIEPSEQWGDRFLGITRVWSDRFSHAGNAPFHQPAHP